MFSANMKSWSIDTLSSSAIWSYWLRLNCHLFSSPVEAQYAVGKIPLCPYGKSMYLSLDIQIFIHTMFLWLLVSFSYAVKAMQVQTMCLAFYKFPRLTNNIMTLSYWTGKLRCIPRRLTSSSDTIHERYLIHLS